MVSSVRCFEMMWGCSSAGRAQGWQSWGQGFDPPQLHQTMMISSDRIARYLQQAMPDVKVAATDRTGTMDHYHLDVISGAFLGKNRLDRQRLVYAALEEAMKDGRIHALEIRSRTPEEAAASPS